MLKFLIITKVIEKVAWQIRKNIWPKKLLFRKENKNSGIPLIKNNPNFSGEIFLTSKVLLIKKYANLRGEVKPPMFFSLEEKEET